MDLEQRKPKKEHAPRWMCLALSLWSICYCFPFGVSCSCHVSVRLTQLVQSDKTQTHRPNFSWLSHRSCQWSKLRTRTLENKNTRKKKTDTMLKWYMQFLLRHSFRSCNGCTRTEVSSLSRVSVLDGLISDSSLTVFDLKVTPWWNAHLVWRISALTSQRCIPDCVLHY